MTQTWEETSWADKKRMAAEQEAAEQKMAEEADRYLAPILAAKQQGYEQAKAEFEVKFSEQLEKELAAREPPPDPIYKLPMMIGAFVDELRKRAEILNGEISLADLERSAADREQSKTWVEAVNKLLFIGVTCHGCFADGDIMLRSEWSGLIHRVRINELTPLRLLQIAGPHGWAALADGDEQLRKLQHGYLAAIAVVAGATLLPGNSESYISGQKTKQKKIGKAEESAAGAAA